MMRPMRVMFAGGGTFGHLSPGLAVAQCLAESAESPQVTFVGRDDPREAALLRRAGFPHRSLPCRPAPRRLGDVLAALSANLRGCRAAVRLLKEYDPDVIVGLGGYASAPLCLVACCQRVPFVLLEQNAVPGIVTRRLARWAHAVCTSYSETKRHLPSRARVMLTGNPVRSGFLQHPPGTSRLRGTHSGPTLIVLGGTGGAATLNRHVPAALSQLRSHLSGWRLLHQAGPGRVDEAAARYRSLGLPVEVRPHFDELPSLLGPNTVAVARAGGSTLAELAATGTPAVLVPYPFAAAGHQAANARAMAAAGAAFCLEQPELERGPETLVTAIQLLLDATTRTRMSDAMRHAAHPEAAAEVAAICRAAAAGKHRFRTLQSVVGEADRVGDCTRSAAYSSSSHKPW